VLTPPPTATLGSLADLCDRDPLDLDADPRLCPGRAAGVRAADPCGALCTPWCLASHGTGALPDR